MVLWLRLVVDPIQKINPVNIQGHLPSPKTNMELETKPLGKGIYQICQNLHWIVGFEMFVFKSAKYLDVLPKNKRLPFFSSYKMTKGFHALKGLLRSEYLEPDRWSPRRADTVKP